MRARTSYETAFATDEGKKDKVEGEPINCYNVYDCDADPCVPLGGTWVCRWSAIRVQSSRWVLSTPWRSPLASSAESIPKSQAIHNNALVCELLLRSDEIRLVLVRSQESRSTE